MSPAALLLLGVLRHQAWTHSSAPSLAWNLCGAVVVSALLLIALRGQRGVLLWLVASWWLYEEALVGICSAWRMWDWWPVAAGEEQCSARVGVHLGALSWVIVGWFAVAAATTPNNKGAGHED